jgi:uncharacterized protein
MHCLIRLLVIFVLVAGHVRLRAAEGQYFLWKIEQDQARVYLLGSIHALRPSDHPLPSIFEEIIAEADQVVFEIHYDEVESLAFLLKSLSASVYPSGQSLRHHVSQETYQLLEEYRQEQGSLLTDQFRPWFIASGIEAQALSQLGFEESYGVDRFLFGLAKQAGKTILALESAGFQIDLLAGLSHETAEQLLLQSLTTRDSKADELEELVATWRTGNLYRLRAYAEAMKEDSPELYRLLLTGRNLSWLEKIEGYLQQNKTTVVVGGAAHFAGDDGLIRLLRNEGVEVQQLPVIPSRLRLQRQPEKRWQLDLELAPGRDYSLQVSGDLQTWEEQGRFYADQPALKLDGIELLPEQRRFFRLEILE